MPRIELKTVSLDSHFLNKTIKNFDPKFFIKIHLFYKDFTSQVEKIKERETYELFCECRAS